MTYSYIQIFQKTNKSGQKTKTVPCHMSGNCFIEYLQEKKDEKEEQEKQKWQRQTEREEKKSMNNSDLRRQAPHEKTDRKGQETRRSREKENGATF